MKMNRKAVFLCQYKSESIYGLSVQVVAIDVFV
jgi:hypothetical protein